jgi:glutamyl-tRNA synthetase
LARLVEAGRAYPAYETAQELELKRKVALGRGLPPIYDRAALAAGRTGASGWIMRRRSSGTT